MGLKPRPPRTRLVKALAAYQRARVRANGLWEIYDGQPTATGASTEELARVREKFGGPLPADYEEFLRLHNGWEGYEYDRMLLSTSEIVDEVASESVEVNIDNIDEDEADMLAEVLVIGCDNASATILYLDRTKAGDPQVVEYYCEEQGRWPSLTDYIESLTSDLNEHVEAELAQQEIACADWDPAMRRKKDAAYQAELADRLQAAEVRKYRGLSDEDLEAVRASSLRVQKVAKSAKDLSQSGLRTYLSFIGYMLYVPTAEEVTTAARVFRKHFPWKGRTLACAPSDEYGRKPIEPDTSDYSEFLKMQTGGHFGLRMVDDHGREATTHIFNFRGAPEYHDEPVATFLEILLPADADHTALRGLTVELAETLPLAHGFAGYAALPLISDYVKHMKILHGWCRAHWGLQIALADELVAGALHGLHGVSWLTLIDNATVDTLRAAGHSLLADTSISVHRRAKATVIQAGEAPILGDIREGYPHSYATVHNALLPLFSPNIGELRHFDYQGTTRAWWRRFEAPAVFALAPEDVFAEVETAARKGDVGALRRAWKQLGGREAAARASLQERLSKLAHRILDKNNDIAMVLYDWLTEMEEPQLHDLNNALVAAWKAPDVAKVFVNRAMPMAEKNPSIFHNVIGLHVEQGELDKAIEIARQSEPHYKIKLFQLLTSDKDFAPLFERPEFVEIYNRMKARLEPSSAWAPLARNPDLESRVGKNADNAAVYREYSAWLSGQNDPRGPLIEAHMDEYEQPRSKPHRTRLRQLMNEYIRNRLMARFPTLGEHLTAEVFHWGVVDTLYLNTWPKAVHADGLRFLEDPECRLLRRLYLRKMKCDLALLAEHVPYLRTLNLNGASFPSLDRVAELGELDELVLSATSVTDLSILGSLSKLRKLYLVATKVTDLSPIKDLPALEFVSLERSSVTDIEPLLDLPRLCELWLYKTAVPKAQAEKVERAIDARKIEPGPGVTRMVYGP